MRPRVLGVELERALVRGDRQLTISDLVGEVAVPGDLTIEIAERGVELRGRRIALERDLGLDDARFQVADGLFGSVEVAVVDRQAFERAG